MRGADFFSVENRRKPVEVAGGFGSEKLSSFMLCALVVYFRMTPQLIRQALRDDRALGNELDAPGEELVDFVDQ
jgi:hypothetical protein